MSQQARDEVTRADFEAALSASEVEPPLMLRRAIYRWRVARHQADALSHASAGSPDARLARCAAHQVRVLEAALAEVRGAAAAWSGREGGTLFVRDEERRPGWVRVDLGPEPHVADVRPGEAGSPIGEEEVVDLVAVEAELVREAIRRVVTNPDSMARCVAESWTEDWVVERGVYLGSGSTTPGLLAWGAYQMTRHLRERKGAAIKPGRK